MKKLFTSESVTEGHPDKVCDLISDSVLDEILRQDPLARVACETCATTGFVLVMGEVTTTAYANIEEVARRAIAEIGYTDSELGFDSKSCAVQVAVHAQSPDIAMGVDASIEQRAGDTDPFDACGAGDQGMMFGYATDETSSYMPIAITLSHALTARLTQVRKDGTLSYLRPDGKSQVTVEYDGDVPVRVDTVLISAQHTPEVTQTQIRQDLLELVVKPVIPSELLDDQTRFLVNPTGAFTVGGPKGDSGLTGRKIIVDTYGGSCPHGGGCFSGKDPTKVDRSASYMARYACKNMVAAGLAKRMQLQVSYAIGVARPVSYSVDTFGTGVLSDARLAEIVATEFDFRPLAIIETLNLRRPIYARTTNYGHFGKADLPWEQTDRVADLQKYLGQTRTIASFEIDHTKLTEGFYLSRQDGDCLTYDLRFVKPNSGDYLSSAVMHTIEHLVATELRHGAQGGQVVYFGPMGCRTGFYAVFRNMTYDTAKDVVEHALQKALAQATIAGADLMSCGNCQEHDLQGAKQAMQRYLNVFVGHQFEYPKI